MIKLEKKYFAYIKYKLMAIIETYPLKIKRFKMLIFSLNKYSET